MTDPTRGLLRELVELKAARGSASFEVRIQDLTTTLVVVDGEVVSIHASKPAEPLGRILVRKGLLTQEQYIEVLERMSEALAIGEKIRFGEVAVELGYVEADGVRRCLAEQLRMQASRVFQSASPTWIRGAVPAERDTARDLKMPVEALFLDAVRWVDDARKGALALDEARSSALHPAWDLDHVDTRFDLTNAEAEFVRTALAGDRTVGELLDDAKNQDTVDAHAILTALLATGAAATHAQQEAVHHPPSSRPPRPAAPLADWAIDAAGAKSALAKLVLARVSLATPAADAFASVQQKLRSEQAFQRGKELLRVGRTEAAASELAAALELEPGSAEYALFAIWARHATADKLAPAAGIELKERAQAALRDNSKFAFAYFVLGEVLRATGDREQATLQFRHALRLDPAFFSGARMKRFGLRASRPSSAELVPLDPTTAARDAVDGSALPSPEVPREVVPAAPPVAAPPAVGPPVAGPPAVGPPVAGPPAAGPVTPFDLAPAAMAAVPVVQAGAGRRMTPLVVALVLLASVTVAAAAFLARSGRSRASAASSPSTSVAPLASAIPSASPAGSLPAVEGSAAARPLEPATSASTRASTSASGAPPAAGAGPSTPPIDPQKGVIVLPAGLVAHRVFVDGRGVVPTNSRVTVSCGHHEVRIGKQARPVPVEVACGRETPFP